MKGEKIYKCLENGCKVISETISKGFDVGQHADNMRELEKELQSDEEESVEGTPSTVEYFRPEDEIGYLRP